MGGRFQADVLPSNEGGSFEKSVAREPPSLPRASASTSRSTSPDRKGKSKGKRRAGRLKIRKPGNHVTELNQSASKGSVSVAPLGSAMHENECRSYERITRGTDDTVTPSFSQPTRLDDDASK